MRTAILDSDEQNIKYLSDFMYEEGKIHSNLGGCFDGSCHVRRHLRMEKS